MIRMVRALAAALLVAAPVAGWAQPSEGLGRCGGRPGARYVVVMDASSSLREDGPSREHTVHEYTRVLRMLSGMLCEADSLEVHAFAPDSVRRMTPLHVLTPANRFASTLRRVARLAIEARTGHTDLHLSLESIRKDILSNHGVLAVFLVTDGSFYPRNPAPDDRTADGLRDRLDALAALVDSLRAAERDPGSPSPALYAIGVRSDDAWAVDQALAPALPASRNARLWKRGSRSLDLRDEKGTHLLSMVFRERFTRLENLSLRRILLATPDALWSRRFGYATGWGVPLQDLQDVTARHLVFLPPAQAMECPAPAAGDDGRAGDAAIPGWVDGRPVCSVEAPSPARLAELGHQGVMEFAVFQGATLTPVHPLAGMHGLHRFVLADSGRTCEAATVAAQFDHGQSWPPRGALPVARMWTVPLDGPGASRDQPEEIDLIRLPRSHCLIPRFTGSHWRREKGEYAIFVRRSEGTTVYRGSFEPPAVRATGP